MEKITIIIIIAILLGIYIAICRKTNEKTKNYYACVVAFLVFACTILGGILEIKGLSPYMSAYNATLAGIVCIEYYSKIRKKKSK